MKEIQIPPPAELVDFEGEPIRDDKGEPAPALTFTKFGRQLLAIPKFAENLDAIEATELRLKVKRKLDEANGKLHLEDEEHKRLLAALKEITPHPHVALCVLPFMHAIRDARDYVPAVLAEPKAEAVS